MNVMRQNLENKNYSQGFKNLLRCDCIQNFLTFFLSVTLPPQPNVTSHSEDELRLTWYTVPGAHQYVARLLFKETLELVPGVESTMNISDETMNLELTHIPPGLHYVLEVCSVNDVGDESCVALEVFGCKCQSFCFVYDSLKLNPSNIRM